jgi:hypothetical protein
MKYTYIVAFVVFAFLLTGCFTKSVVEEVEIPLASVEVSENNIELVEPSIDISEDTTSTGSETDQ